MWRRLGWTVRIPGEPAPFDHMEDLSPEEIDRSLKEVADVMGLTLERDAALALKKSA